MHGGLADVMMASETFEDRNVGREQQRTPGWDAATMVRSVTGLDGVEVRSGLHANCS